MWNALIVIVGLASLVKLCLAARELRCQYTLFLGGAIWLRYVLSAYHEITFSPVLSGLSINALASMGVVGAGMLLIPKRFWMMKNLLPIYVFLFCVMISTVVSGQFVAFLGVLTKWLYLCVIALTTYLAMKRHGSQKILLFLMIPLSVPIILQLFSIALGVAKQTEGDGSISFIGGYNHEAAFSVVVFTFMTILILLDRKSIKLQLPFVLFSIFCLVMVNYRTALLAAVPVVCIFFWEYAISSVYKGQRVFVIILLIIVTFVFIAVVFPTFNDRFSDLSVVIKNGRELLKPDVYYSSYEQDLFSARLYIWSQYLTDFIWANDRVLAIGFGPDFWKLTYDKYAHNTFVSYLYEFGFIGLIAFFGVLFKPVWMMVRSKATSSRNILLASHASFLILNMATMPLWQIEGIILYAILVGYTWFYSRPLVEECRPVNLVRWT